MNPIGYVHKTWNPVVGCSPISEGCQNCWARQQARLHAPRFPAHAKVAKWQGRVELVPQALDRPSHWRGHQRIAVCLMGDLFHENVPPEWQNAVLTRAGAWRQHSFLFLTKRPEEMRKALARQLFSIRNGYANNIWLGVTVEDQRYVHRIATLLKTKAAVRWVSLEPLLGPVGLDHTAPGAGELMIEGLDWVVVGPETGPRHRPCELQWIVDVTRQCMKYGVPIWVKAVPLADGRILKDITDPRWPTWALRQLPE